MWEGVILSELLSPNLICGLAIFYRYAVEISDSEDKKKEGQIL